MFKFQFYIVAFPHLYFPKKSKPFHPFFSIGIFVSITTIKNNPRSDFFIVFCSLFRTNDRIVFYFGAVMDWKSFRDLFDTELETYMRTQLDTVQPYIIWPDLGSIYEFLIPFSKGGKRIRPYLVYLFYKLAGGTDTTLAVQTGIVNEIIHLFALIHDDINDKGTMRHHLPTFHKFAEAQLDDDYQWINIGILVGDILLSRAYQHLHTLPLSGQTKSLYFDMLNTTMYGQIQDVYLSYTPTLYPKEIIAAKDKAKSGNYSFMRPMVIGHSLAQQGEHLAIKQLGERLGLVFQMRDDLLDIIDGHGDKTAFSDHQEGNQTFLLAYAYEHATADQQAYLLATRGKPCDAETIAHLLDIYTTTGTIARARQEINDQLATCRTEFADRVATTSSIDHTYIPYVEDLIDFLAIS